VSGSTLFFVAAPGTVAGVLPWALTGWRVGASLPWPLRLLGALMVFVGVLVLVSAFARFVVEGAGTPAPIAETDRLVVGGLYRFIRNPMYVAVLLVIAGQAMLLGRWVLVIYDLFAAVAMLSFVKGYEEPRLLQRYGSQYRQYRQTTPGWWPRLRPRA
jgi:protein-S-isoprenylcysteine O-methyltransferase Ste14